MNIGYPHCEINNAFLDVGNSIAVKPASKSKLSKVKGLCIFFSVLSMKSEKLSGVLTLTGGASLQLACA